VRAPREIASRVVPVGTRLSREVGAACSCSQLSLGHAGGLPCACVRPFRNTMLCARMSARMLSCDEFLAAWLRTPGVVVRVFCASACLRRRRLCAVPQSGRSGTIRTAGPTDVKCAMSDSNRLCPLPRGRAGARPAPRRAGRAPSGRRDRTGVRTPGRAGGHHRRPTLVARAARRSRRDAVRQKITIKIQISARSPDIPLGLGHRFLYRFRRITRYAITSRRRRVAGAAGLGRSRRPRRRTVATAHRPR